MTRKAMEDFAGGLGAAYVGNCGVSGRRGRPERHTLDLRNLENPELDCAFALFCVLSVEARCYISCVSTVCVVIYIKHGWEWGVTSAVWFKTLYNQHVFSNDLGFRVSRCCSLIGLGVARRVRPAVGLVSRMLRSCQYCYYTPWYLCTPCGTVQMLYG